MNVFVLCAGYCGSAAFAASCNFMTNYTVGHESRDGLLGVERLTYPDYHIEVDSRLAWLLGRLDAIYGDKAFYAHLERNIEDVVNTTAKKVHNGFYSSRVAEHYRRGITRYCKNADVTDEQARLSARDYVQTVSSNISLFLRDKEGWYNKGHIRVEKAEDDLPLFWEAIGAEGDLDGAIAFLKRRHKNSEIKWMMPHIFAAQGA